MTKVINLVGAPGVGKTLMSCLVFSKLKMMHLTAEYVQEFAKTLVWQQRYEELYNQYYTTYEQYKMIKAIDGAVDYIVCDSGLILGLFYNIYNEQNVSNVEKTQAMILGKMKEFDNIYIFLERNETLPFEKAGRLQTEEECKKINDNIKQLLIDNDLQFKSFLSSERSVDGIIEYILSF